MRCPGCRAMVSEGASLCPHCGTPIGDGILSPDPTRTMPGPGIPQVLFAGKYRILEKIGAGGMGIVYKVEDTKLERIVALKLLPPELSRDKEAKSRFIREARSAAALEHPHICTVYEVDEAGGETYIAMAYIQGPSLKDRLVSGPLGIEEAQALALQVAEGVHEAHEKGIIHRDIKPANIMLTAKGEAKIMDFGLAKLAGAVDLTRPSMIVGTVAYMSPEQARGEAVDHRTDIWSFGAVFYEMLTGERPFRKGQEHALIQAILNDRPKTLRELRPDTPKAIERIVLKALEKDRARRYQSMGEVLGDLKAARPPATGVPEPKKSIIVLPFENISPDPEQDYFCDGMTEELITDLSHIRDLLVISRSSAMTFKGTKKTAPEIARSVNVRYVLEGSVRKAGKSLRITAQLIDADTDAHLWAEKYNGILDDVFDIQEKVSRAIAEKIQLKLTPEEKARIGERGIDSLEAYELYWKARREIYRLTKEGLDKALQNLQKGLQIAGENVLLYSCMGNVYYQYWNYGVGPDLSNLQKANDCAERVFAMEPNSPHGHFLLGLLRVFNNPPQALTHFQRVLAADPYHPEALLWLTLYLVFQGMAQEADFFMKRLTSVDPLNPIVRILPGNLHFHCGRFDLAIKELKKACDDDPGHFVARFHYAKALASVGRREEAVAVIDDILDRAQEDLRTRLFRLYKLAFQGKRADVAGAVGSELSAWAQRDWMVCLWLVEIFALVHETEKALDWLDKAVELGAINYPFLNEYDPLLQNLRGEPRFQALMERIKREWKSFEV
jgi:serine/threonine protein kinase/tetratricopeptide (TPR) repeat protein